MRILLSWQLVIVLALFLLGFASSELESPDDRVTDPIQTSIDSRTASTKKPAPTKMFSMQHESFCINIYESQEISNKKKEYFHSPITLLEHTNVTPLQNKLQVRFHISNSEVLNKVLERLNLKLQLSKKIELNQVKVLPYDSVRLTSKVQSPDFSLIDEWILYDNPLRFSLICPTREDCNRVRDQILDNPEKFDHLRLEFKSQFNDDICSIGSHETSQTVNNNDLFINLRDQFEAQVTSIKEGLSDKIQNMERNLAETRNKLESTEAKLNAASELINNVNDLTTKLNASLERIVQDQKAVEDSLRKELGATSANFDSTKMKQDLGNAIDAVAELTKQLNARTNEIVDIGKMPTSCSDLQRIGHKLNGFFMVKSVRKMETVYCNFYPNNNYIQKWIGYADVKSEPVYFFVKSSSKFDTINSPIQFKMQRENEGNAFSLETGIFTAPRPGIYFFSFIGLADFLTSSSKVLLGVSLQLNRDFKRDSVGMAYVDDLNTTDRKSTVTIQSTLKLKKNDQVWVEITFMESSSLFGTYFTGFLLEEELSPFLN